MSDLISLVDDEGKVRDLFTKSVKRFVTGRGLPPVTDFTLEHAGTRPEVLARFAGDSVPAVQANAFLEPA